MNMCVFSFSGQWSCCGRGRFIKSAAWLNGVDGLLC